MTPSTQRNIINVARVLYGIDVLRKTGRTLIQGSHRPLNGDGGNVRSLVASDETGFKVFDFKGPIRK